MDARVLVAYGTKHGATQEIAERIGQVLEEAGLVVDVRNARQVETLTAYDAVVLGSGVYVGAWCKEAAAFLKTNVDKLATLPVWIFSSGPTSSGNPQELVQGWQLPKKLEPLAARIQPRDVTIFHGATSDRMSFIEKWMVKQVGASMGDFRDWDAIAAWAKSIAGALEGAAA